MDLHRLPRMRLVVVEEEEMVKLLLGAGLLWTDHLLWDHEVKVIFMEVGEEIQDIPTPTYWDHGVKVLVIIFVYPLEIMGEE